MRQGDPLSPLLFCIAEDVLSRAISNLVHSGELTPIAGPKGCPTLSHVLYADDIMIFCRGTKSNLRNIMNTFRLYGEAFGQILSPQKSKYYHGSIPSNRLVGISSLLGFSAKRLPFTYLGVPIFKGKPKRSFLQPIADRIKAKLATWRGSLLSIMDRVQLVKSIIQGMLIYSFHIYAWPISLLKTVDQWIRNFIWSEDIMTRKVVAVAWHKVYSPFLESGLGIKPLRSINAVASLKLCWNVLTNSGHWASFLRARFLVNGAPSPRYFCSSIWSPILITSRRLMTTLPGC